MVVYDPYSAPCVAFIARLLSLPSLKDEMIVCFITEPLKLKSPATGSSLSSKLLSRPMSQSAAALSLPASL